MSLQEKALLVKLKIRQWDGFKKDKRVAEDVDVRFKTAGKAGNYNKRLLDPSVLKPLNKITSKLRVEHNRVTTPFAYDGVSVLAKELFFDYRNMFTGFKTSFINETENFLTQYPIHKANRASELGDMFDPADYPSVEQLRSKFEMSVKFFPVPASDHFIVDMEKQYMDELRDGLMDELADTQRASVQSLYDRVSALLMHMHERLSDPQNVFRDTLVENIQQMVEVLPAMNMFDDPVLCEVHERLQKDVLIVDAQDLRVDMPMRKHIATTAFDLANLLNGGEANAQPGPSEASH